MVANSVEVTETTRAAKNYSEMTSRCRFCLLMDVLLVHLRARSSHRVFNTRCPFAVRRDRQISDVARRRGSAAQPFCKGVVHRVRMRQRWRWAAGLARPDPPRPDMLPPGRSGLVLALSCGERGASEDDRVRRQVRFVDGTVWCLTQCAHPRRRTAVIYLAEKFDRARRLAKRSLRLPPPALGHQPSRTAPMNGSGAAACTDGASAADKLRTTAVCRSRSARPRRTRLWRRADFAIPKPSEIWAPGIHGAKNPSRGPRRLARPP